MQIDQVDKLLAYFRKTGGAKSWELVENLHLPQYNYVILKARKRLGCLCVHGSNSLCEAKEHIISVEDNQFIYTTTAEEQLNNLRRRFFALAHELEFDAEQVKERAKAKFNKQSFSDLTFEEVSELIKKLEATLVDRYYQPIISGGRS